MHKLLQRAELVRIDNSVFIRSGMALLALNH